MTTRLRDASARVRAWVTTWKDTITTTSALLALTLSLYAVFGGRRVDRVTVRVIEFSMAEANARSFPKATVAFVNQGTNSAVVANIQGGLVGGGRSAGTGFDDWEWSTAGFEPFALAPGELRVVSFDPPTMSTEKLRQVPSPATVTFCMRVHSVDSSGSDMEIMFPLGKFDATDAGFIDTTIGPDISYQLFSHQFIKPCDVAPAYWPRPRK